MTARRTHYKGSFTLPPRSVTKVGGQPAPPRTMAFGQLFNVPMDTQVTTER